LGVNEPTSASTLAFEAAGGGAGGGAAGGATATVVGDVICFGFVSVACLLGPATANCIIILLISCLNSERTSLPILHYREINKKIAIYF